MPGMSFRWVRGSPDDLARNVQQYGDQALAAVHAVAAYWGQMVQDEARRNARWEDRTGNARSGLFFAIDGFGLPPITGHVPSSAMAQLTDATVERGSKGLLIVTLGHTVFYGRFLELSRGARYAVVMSTIERNLPTLERMLKDLLRG